MPDQVAGLALILDPDGPCDFCNGDVQRHEPPYRACEFHYRERKKQLEDENIPTAEIEVHE